jgi:hypothetical protein
MVAAVFVAALNGESGCSRSFVVPPNLGPPGSQPATRSVVAAAAPGGNGAPKPAEQPCDVWLQIATSDATIASRFLCIKRTGAPFRFPSPIYFEGREGHIDTQFNGMCAPEDGAPATSATTTSGVSSKSADRCQWSHLFRSNYPLSFTIKTASRDKPLATFAHIIRVFRNGKLVFSWKDDNVLSQLVVPGETLKAHLMPFGAPMDLRIIPAGSPDDPRIETRVGQTIDPITSRLEIVKAVLLGPSGANVNVPEQVACVAWLASQAKATALQIAGKAGQPATPAPQDCHAPATGSAQDLHDQITASIQDGLQTANQGIEAAIRAIGTQYGVAIENAAEKAKQTLQREVPSKVLSNGLTVSRTIDEVNQLAAQAAEIFDTLSRDVHTTLANVKQLVTDRDAQAREYAAVTEALAQSGSVFQPFTKNPELVQDEKALDMHYGDKFQFFLLAPWNGVPIRVTRNVGATLGIENAIPILDVAGFRYQWGTGRGDSVRVGAGIMYFKDETQQIPVGTATMQNVSVFNVASELSVSWFGFMMGAGYVLNDRDFHGFWNRDRVRVLVGVDLLKVFGNAPAEAISF